ncbi:MAG: hypothetical protein AB7N71_13805 [Phycisphaerae bacterium]
MKNALLTVVALLGFGGAGYLIYRGTTSTSSAPDHFEAAGACLDCKQEVHVKHGAMEVEPFLCSACGKKAVFKWMYCFQCNRRFVPMPAKSPIDGTPCLPAHPECSGCHCADVTYFIEGFENQIPAGDVPLPPLQPK